MLACFLALTLAAAPPSSGVREFDGDLIELNHFYDEKGVEVYQQVILWRLASRGRVCEGFLLWPRGGVRLPGGCVVPHRQEVFRLRAPLWQETWSQVDPEMEDRAVHGVRHRLFPASDCHAAPP